MKRIILYLIILTLTLLVPVDQLDVAKLRPIEVIYVYKEENQVVLRTDTRDLGVGANAAQALADMRSTSPAVIYLDTAEFLLIGENAGAAAEELRGELKESVRLCAARGEIDLSLAAAYLAVHGDLPDFQVWNMDTRLPLIYTEKEMLKMSKNNEKTA